jgi:4-amino-4-deoxy-L-arabinose transferase-like glycosyltransferase
MHKNAMVMKGILLLLFFCLLLNIPYIHLREFQGEEGRRVIIAATMLKTGEWIVPYVENVPYLKKPPLFNWLLAGIFRLTGIVSETTARMLSVLSVFLCALSLSLFWKKIARIRDAWFILPGLIFLTFTDVMDKAVRAEIDMTFTLFITLAVLLWFYLYENLQKPTTAWIVSLSFVSVATLTKGLQAPAFFYCGVLPYLVYKREIRRFFSASHIAGVCAALAIFSAWFVPFTERIGTEEVLKTWWHEIATRQEPIKAGGFFRHFVEFPLLYLIAYLPWLPLMFLWMHKEIREKAEVYKKLLMYCFFFLLFSVPFYWIMPGARLRYILPVSGMLALLLAIPISFVFRDPSWKPSWIKRYLQLFGILSCLTVLASPFWGKRFELFQDPVPVLLLVAVFSLSLLLIVQQGEVKKKLVLFFLITLLVKISWASLYFPYHAKYLSHYRTAAQQINALLPLDVLLYDYRVDNQHLAYYLKRQITLIKYFDMSTMKNGTIVFMEKKTADSMDLQGLSYIGEVEARRDRLLFYEIVNGGKNED